MNAGNEYVLVAVDISRDGYDDEMAVMLNNNYNTLI